MPRKPAIAEGDSVILRGRVTRVAEPNQLGWIYVTVRIEGVDVPVTLNERWVEKG